jgi:hypothetical protein
MLRWHVNEVERWIDRGRAKRSLVVVAAHAYNFHSENEKGIMEVTQQPKGTIQAPDTVATDAVEVAFAALDEYPGTKKDKGLQALRDMLWAAMMHARQDGGTPESRQAFYDKVADLACGTAMAWHCTMTRELLAAFKARAQKGNFAAKQIEENFTKAGLGAD